MKERTEERERLSSQPEPATASLRDLNLKLECCRDAGFVFPSFFHPSSGIVVDGRNRVLGLTSVLEVNVIETFMV